MPNYFTRASTIHVGISTGRGGGLGEGSGSILPLFSLLPLPLPLASHRMSGSNCAWSFHLSLGGARAAVRAHCGSLSLSYAILSLSCRIFLIIPLSSLLSVLSLLYSALSSIYLINSAPTSLSPSSWLPRVLCVSWQRLCPILPSIPFSTRHL